MLTELDDLPRWLVARYRGLVDRLSLICHASPYSANPTAWAQLIARARAAFAERSAAPPAGGAPGLHRP